MCVNRTPGVRLHPQGASQVRVGAMLLQRRDCEETQTLHRRRSQGPRGSFKAEEARSHRLNQNIQRATCALNRWLEKLAWAALKRSPPKPNQQTAADVAAEEIAVSKHKLKDKGNTRIKGDSVPSPTAASTAQNHRVLIRESCWSHCAVGRLCWWSVGRECYQRRVPDSA